MQFKSNTKTRLGHGLIHLTGSKFVTMFISLLSGMLLARFRTVNEYGTYSQMLIVITLAVSFFTFGLPASSNFFLARADTEEERSRFLSVFYTLNTVLCILIGIILFASIPLIEKYFNNIAIHSFAYFLAIYPWAKITIDTISNVLVVYGKTKKLMLINFLVSIVALVSILLTQLLGWTFHEYVLSFFVGNILIAFWIYTIVFKLESNFSFHFDRELTYSIATYSVPIGLAVLVSTINVEVDKLMIGGLLGTESLAYYAVAGKELPLSLVGSTLTTLLMPVLTKKIRDGHNKEVISIWGISIQLSFILSCFFTTMCISYAPQIISILYSEKYLPGVNIFRIYSLILLLKTTYWGIVLNALGKTQLILKASLVSLCINVLLNYLFFIIFGFIGPAMASIFSIAVVALFQLYLTSVLLGVSLHHLLPWKKLTFILFINILWGGFSYVILNYLNIGTDTISIAKTVFVGILFVLLYVLVIRTQIKQLWKEFNDERYSLSV